TPNEIIARLGIKNNGATGALDLAPLYDLIQKPEDRLIQFKIIAAEVLDKKSPIAKLNFVGAPFFSSEEKAIILVNGMQLMFQVCKHCSIQKGFSSEPNCSTVICGKNPIILRIKTENDSYLGSADLALVTGL